MRKRISVLYFCNIRAFPFIFIIFFFVVVVGSSKIVETAVSPYLPEKLDLNERREQQKSNNNNYEHSMYNQRHRSNWQSLSL